jgi:hypothetical protein
LRQRQGSGRQVGRLFSALARHATRIIAPIHARAAIHTVTALHKDRMGRLATFGPATPIDSRAPIHQGTALRMAAPLLTGMGHGGRHAA